MAPADNLVELLDILRTKTFPANVLVTKIYTPEEGVTLGGNIIPDLPDSALDSVRPAAATKRADAYKSILRTKVPVQPLPWPTDDEVVALALALADRVATKLLALLARSHDDEVVPDDDGLLAERHTDAMNRGRIVVPPDAEPHLTKPRCAFKKGFSVHADVRIHANDRLALSRLLAYAARPPCPEERLTRLPDGRPRCASSALGRVALRKWPSSPSSSSGASPA